MLAVRHAPGEVDYVIVIVHVLRVAAKQSSIPAVMGFNPGVQSKVAIEEQVFQGEVSSVV